MDIGAFAIYLGYKLFATATTGEGAANAALGTFQIYISHVGPGVFFALFGAGLVGYAVTRPITVTPSGTVRGMMVAPSVEDSPLRNCISNP